MRFTNRLTIAISAIVIFSAIITGCSPDSGPPASIEKARGLEKEGRRTEALAEYGRVAKQKSNSSPELAAQALLEGGEFARSRFGLSQTEKDTGQDTALQLWKQLRDQFPNSKEWAELQKATPQAPDGLFHTLELEIDKRNSTHWMYKAVDTIVGLTGRSPGFSYAFTLIFLAIAVKAFLFPFTKKQYASMRAMQEIQPELKELQAKYKGVDLHQKMQELYKERGVNPFASCLPTLLTLPFLLGVFTSIRLYEMAFSQGKFLWIGSSLSKTNPTFFGQNLAAPDMPLLIVYAISNYITMKLTPASDPQQQQTQNSIAVISSVMLFWMFLTYRWSSAFLLYWFVMNILSIIQQYVMVYKPHLEKKKLLADGGAGGGVVLPPTKTGGPGSGAKSANVAPASSAATPNEITRVRPRKKADPK